MYIRLIQSSDIVIKDVLIGYPDMFCAQIGTGNLRIMHTG